MFCDFEQERSDCAGRKEPEGEWRSGGSEGAIECLKGKHIRIGYLLPLPGSSASVLSLTGVVCSSSPDSPPSAMVGSLDRELGMGWFSRVRERKSPPFALRSSRISFGGGSSPQYFAISYALVR